MTNFSTRQSGRTRAVQRGQTDAHEQDNSRNSLWNAPKKRTRFAKEEYRNLYISPFLATCVSSISPQRLRSTPSLHQWKTRDFTKCTSLFLRSWGTRARMPEAQWWKIQVQIVPAANHDASHATSPADNSLQPHPLTAPKNSNTKVYAGTVIRWPQGSAELTIHRINRF